MTRRPSASRAAAVGALFAAILGQAPAPVRAAAEPGTEDADALLLHPSRDNLPTHPGAFCDRVGARGKSPDGQPMRCTLTPGQERPRWRLDG